MFIVKIYKPLHRSNYTVVSINSALSIRKLQYLQLAQNLKRSSLPTQAKMVHKLERSPQQLSLSSGAARSISEEEAESQ